MYLTTYHFEGDPAGLPGPRIEPLGDIVWSNVGTS
jgi:hypothetical protein